MHRQTHTSKGCLSCMMMTVLPLLLESFVEAVETNAWSALTATNREGQVTSWGYVCSVLAPCLLRHFLVLQSLRSSSSWCIPLWQCFLQLGEVQAALLHQGFEIGLHNWPPAVGHTVPCVAGNLWAS